MKHASYSFLIPPFTILVLACFTSCVTMIKCPPFDTTNLEWFSYQEGDTIFFENGKEYREYIVDSYTAYHSKNYPSNIKCCGCNDHIDLFIVGARDSLNIRILYQNRGNNSILYITNVICNKNRYETKQTDDLLQLNFLNIHNDYKITPDNLISNIIIKKGVGIVAFNSNNEEWKLREHRKNRIAKSVKILKEDHRQ